MFQFKVIGNTLPKHNFQIGSIVTMRMAGLSDNTAAFELGGESNTLQIVNMADVEATTLSQQEAALILSGMVDDINRRITDAETMADEHGLSFSIDIAYGMGGTYYGDGNEQIGRRYGPEAGWNPSSMSC